MGQTSIEGLPGKYKNPVLAMELVKDRDDLKTLLLIREAREFIDKQLGQDTTFIVLYVLLFATLGHLTSSLWSGPTGKTGRLLRVWRSSQVFVTSWKIVECGTRSRQIKTH